MSPSLRGCDDHPLFTRSVPGTNGMRSAYAAGAVLQRGHCADVLTIGQGCDTSLLADLASKEQPRWTLIRRRSDHTAGTVTSPKTAPAPTAPDTRPNPPLEGSILAAPRSQGIAG